MSTSADPKKLTPQDHALDAVKELYRLGHDTTGLIQTEMTDKGPRLECVEPLVRAKIGLRFVMREKERQATIACRLSDLIMAFEDMQKEREKENANNGATIKLENKI